MKGKNCYTFGMIKPDGMKNKEGIIRKIYDAGLKIAYYKCETLDENLIDQNYSHVMNRDFYPMMKENLLSGPSLLMLIYYPNGDAVNKYRKVLGATNSSLADPDTIRGCYGDKEISYKNAAHGSGTTAEAIDEVIRFFKNDLFDIFSSINYDAMYEVSLVSNEFHPKYIDEDNIKTMISEINAYLKGK